MAQRTIHRSDGFDKDLKKLCKKYRDLEGSLKVVLEAVATSDAPPGKQIPGLNGAPVYKERVPCGNKGKRGGGRIIYHATPAEAHLLFVYVKNDVEDIPNKVLRDALADAGLLPETGTTQPQ